MSQMKKPTLYAYATSEGNDGKTYYHRIGAAWPTNNGGYSIKLVANPISGDFVLFPPREKVQTEPHDQ